MDGFRDRFGSRYDRNNSSRSTQTRNNADRMSNDRGMSNDRSMGMDRSMDRSMGMDRFEGDYGYDMGREDYGGRDYGEPRRSRQPDANNSRQLEVIKDYLEEAKEDRISSEKNILHAVDNNSKMLDRGLDILGELQEGVEKINKNAGKSSSSDEEAIDMEDIEALSTKNKQELLAAIAGNKELLNAVKEEIEARADEILTAAAARAAAESNKEEDDEDDKESLSDLISGLEDHVHKESVKCYRNVLGAFEEHEKGSGDKVLKSVGTVKIFSIIQLALTVVNLGLLILYIFRIL